MDLEKKKNLEDDAVVAVVNNFATLAQRLKAKPVKVYVPKRVDDVVRTAFTQSNKRITLEFQETTEHMKTEHQRLNVARRVVESVLFSRVRTENVPLLVMGLHVDRVVRKRLDFTVFHDQATLLSSKDATRLVDMKEHLKSRSYEHEKFVCPLVDNKKDLDKLILQRPFKMGLSYCVSRAYGVTDIISLMIDAGLKRWRGFEYGSVEMFSGTKGEFPDCGFSYERDTVNSMIIFRYDTCVTPDVCHPIANLQGFFYPGVYGVRGKWFSVQQMDWFSFGVEYVITETKGPISLPPVQKRISEYVRVRSFIPVLIGACKWKYKEVDFLVHTSVHTPVWTQILEIKAKEGRNATLEEILRFVIAANATRMFNLLFVGAKERVSPSHIFAYALACYVVVNAEIDLLEKNLHKAQAYTEQLFARADIINAFAAYFSKLYDVVQTQVVAFLKALQKMLGLIEFSIDPHHVEIRPIRSVDLVTYLTPKEAVGFVADGDEIEDLNTIGELLRANFAANPESFDEPTEESLLPTEEPPPENNVAEDGRLFEEAARAFVDDLAEHHNREKKTYERSLLAMNPRVSKIPYVIKLDQSRYKLTFSGSKAKLVSFSAEPNMNLANQVHISILENWRDHGLHCRAVVLAPGGNKLILMSRETGFLYDHSNMTITCREKANFSVGFFAGTSSWMCDRFLRAIRTVEKIPNWTDVLEKVEFINHDQITGAGKTVGMVTTALPYEPLFGSTNNTIKEIAEKIKAFTNSDLQTWKNRIFTVDRLTFKMSDAWGDPLKERNIREQMFDPAHVVDGRARIAIDEAVTLHPAQIIMFVLLYCTVVLPSDCQVQVRLEGDTKQNVWYAGRIFPTNSKLITAFWYWINKTAFVGITRRCPLDTTAYLSTFYGRICRTTNHKKFSIMEPKICPVSSVPYDPQCVYYTMNGSVVGDIKAIHKAKVNYKNPRDRIGDTTSTRVIQGGSFKKTCFADTQNHTSVAKLHASLAMRLVAASRHTEEYHSIFATPYNNPVFNDIFEARKRARLITDWSKYMAKEEEIPPPKRWLENGN